MKIAILNQPLGNRGDEAAHRALIRRLLQAFPEYQIDVIFLNKKQEMINDFIVNSNRVNYINICGIEQASVKCMKLTMFHNNLIFTKLHPLLRKFEKTIINYNCVICAPGGICMGGFMNWAHIWQLYLAMKHHIKTIYWGRSIGPFDDYEFDHVQFKKISCELLNYFDYISLRDEVSIKIAKSMNIQTDLTVDSAFLETPNSSIPDRISKLIGTAPYVVYVPNELKWHYKYKEYSKEYIDDFNLFILEKIFSIFPDHHVVMLPQTCRTTINDYKYFISIKDKSKNKDRIIVVDENQSSDIQQIIIKNSSFVVGARYHSIIFALNNNVPFLSLSYEHKMKGILEILNLTDQQIDLEESLKNRNFRINNTQRIDYLLNNGAAHPKELIMAKTIVEKAFNEMIRHI